MYDKNTHTNVRKRTRIQMYEKEHAYKHAYKCMTNTRIQMYEKNMHTNV